MEQVLFQISSTVRAMLYNIKLTTLVPVRLNMSSILLLCLYVEYVYVSRIIGDSFYTA